MAVVLGLHRGVDAHDHPEFGDRAVVRRRGDRHLLGQLALVEHVEPGDGEALTSREPEALDRVALVELQRHHAHADEVGAVDALEALRDHGAHAEQRRALGRPVAAAPRSVFSAGQHDQRHVLLRVVHRRLVDGGLRSVGKVHGHAALGARRELVAQPHVGESPAHHDLVVAAPRAVRVEIPPLDAVIHEVLARRRRGTDGAGRRDVVRRDAVAHHHQDPRVGDVGHRRRRHRHRLEEGRVLHVGGGVLPRVGLAALHLDLAPVFVAVEDRAVARIGTCPR